MKCSECGRELREDSKFCDYCGSLVKNKVVNEEIKSQLSLNKSALLSGILASVLITLLISGLAGAFGIPLLFGGLFLPFFFMRKKKEQ